MIEAGTLEKIVLARAVDVAADRPFDVRSVCAQLRRTQPGCVVYAHGGFVGASPELLVRKRGTDVVSRPLAGTGEDAQHLLASAKDAHEHRIVVDAVAASLRDLCANVQIHGPAPLELADVTHLATTLTGHARAGTTIANLLRSLHPTPAVAGTPRTVALETIHRLEPVERDRYAGPCGWIDERGDGEFVVALRCAHLDGTTARCYAGAGIVAGSQPDAEWAETEQKLEPMLRVLVRP
jgi:menaquinone-specific isochorismate synthase